MDESQNMIQDTSQSQKSSYCTNWFIWLSWKDKATSIENKLVATRVINRGKFWLQKCSMRDFGKGYGIPLEKAMAPHSSTLAWKIPWTEEPGWLQSMGSWRVRHSWTPSLSLFTFMDWRRKWQPIPVFLPGESQGQGTLGGLPSMGSHRVGHDWSDLAAAATTFRCYHNRYQTPKPYSYCLSIKCLFSFV